MNKQIMAALAAVSAAIASPSIAQVSVQSKPDMSKFQRQLIASSVADCFARMVYDTSPKKKGINGYFSGLPSTLGATESLSGDLSHSCTLAAGILTTTDRRGEVDQRVVFDAKSNVLGEEVSTSLRADGKFVHMLTHQGDDFYRVTITQTASGWRASLETKIDSQLRQGFVAAGAQQDGDHYSFTIEGNSFPVFMEKQISIMMAGYKGGVAAYQRALERQSLKK